MTVEELLQERKVNYKLSPADCIVSCLNPEHDDNNPSMRIDRITGVYNCFSCGFRGNIFNYYNAPSNPLDIRRQKVRQKIEEKRASSVGLKMPKNFMPYVGNWREITPETYKKFNAFLHPDKPFTNRISFPIKDLTGRIVAFNCRTQSPTEVPKYLIHPPKAVLPLFPAQVRPIKGRVILVEGIFDAINLHDKGLENAVCCFGTRNIDVEKLKLLKMQGVSAVDILFDPDEAGQEAAVRVQELCDIAEILHKNVKIPIALGDAGALTKNKVKELKENLYG
jgi:DNA primase